LSDIVGGINPTRRLIVLNFLGCTLAKHYGTDPGTDEFAELVKSFLDSLQELCEDEKEGL